MELIKLLERIVLGKKIFKENEKVREEIRDIKRRRESEAFKKEMLEAVAVNKAIDVKADKIRAETWKMIREIELRVEELGEKIKRFIKRKRGIEQKL